MSTNDLEQQNCYKNQLSLKVLFSQGQKTIQEPIFFMSMLRVFIFT